MKRLLIAVACVVDFLPGLAVSGPGPKAIVAVLHADAVNVGAARAGTANVAAVAGKLAAAVRPGTAGIGAANVAAGATGVAAAVRPGTAGSGVANVALANAGAARFQFKHLIAGMEARDSILIIFDRYDHTGAGIVYQVFAADREQGITVPSIPPGKYYVTVQCIGLHRDRLEKIVTIRSQRSETVRIELAACEAFSKTAVVIPIFHPNPAALAVVRKK